MGVTNHLEAEQPPQQAALDAAAQMGIARGLWSLLQWLHPIGYSRMRWLAVNTGPNRHERRKAARLARQ